MLAEYSQYAPLLIRETMLTQAGACVLHHGFARFQQQSGQVAVSKRDGVTHLFNMLNEWSLC